MQKEVKFNSKSLLDITFEKDVKGYNPLQVDETLDSIILDYDFYEKEIEKLHKNTAELTQEIKRLKTLINEKDLELAKANTKIKAMPKENINGLDNVALLKRIDALERALYKKGADPKKI